MGLGGFLKGMANELVTSTQERAKRVSELKEEYERRYSGRGDEEIFRAMSRISPTSEQFGAMSLLLQDRGYSSNQIVDRVKELRRG